VCDILPFPKPSAELSRHKLKMRKQKTEKRAWSPVGFGELPFSAALFRDLLWPFFVALSRCFLCDFLFHLRTATVASLAASESERTRSCRAGDHRWSR